MERDEGVSRARLRTPRSAAVAGIVFSVLLVLALVLIIVSTPSDPRRAGEWLSDSGRRGAVALALNLIPFAGIAFLWFIGVVRDRVGEHEDRFFATVFLGSGLLFVGMLFVAAAFAGGLIADLSGRAALTPGRDVLANGRQITSLLLRVYAMRMAAVFMFSTATITRRTQVIPQWISVLGYVLAAVLLVSVGFTPWVTLLFPIWIFVLSVEILRTSWHRSEQAA